MIELQEVFGVSLPVTVTIDRSKTFEEMFRAADRVGRIAGITSFDHAVRQKYDLYRRHVVETVEIRGFGNERGMITTTILTELDTFGVVPASIIHWLAFSALCPDSLKDNPEVFLFALGGGYVTARMERMISKGKLDPSARDVPYTFYFPSHFGIGENEKPKGPFQKVLGVIPVEDHKRFSAHKYIFLAVAKQGQG